MLETEINRLTSLIYDTGLDSAYGPELLDHTARVFRGCNASFGVATADLRFIPCLDAVTQQEVLTRVSIGSAALLLRRELRNTR